MLRKSRVLFPTRKQEFKNKLIDSITNEEETIQDFFNTVGKSIENITQSERHKVLRQVLLDKDLWDLLSKKIDDHLSFVLGVETDAIVLLDSPNLPIKAKGLIKPFVLDYLEDAGQVTKAIESLRKLREAMVNDKQ